MSKELKYEYFNIIDIVNELDIMVNHYVILSTFNSSSKKAIYVIKDIKTNNKFLLIAKLRDFHRNEFGMYLKLKNICDNCNYCNNLIQIRKIFLTEKLLVVITDYVDNSITLNDTEYYDYFKNDLENIFFQVIDTMNYMKNLGYICSITPDDVILSIDKDMHFNVTIVDFDLCSDENNMLIILSFCFYIFQGAIKKNTNINYLLEHYDGKYTKMVKYIYETHNSKLMEKLV